MSKTLLAAILATVATGALADDGQILFNGNIIDQACTVVNDMSNPLTVTLGTISTTSLNGQAGKTAAPTSFKIALRNCPQSVTAVSVKFDGQPANGDNTALRLTQSPATASNVGIQIKDHNDMVVPLYTASSSYPINYQSDNAIPFVARYVALADQVEAGSANSVANFTIVHN